MRNGVIGNADDFYGLTHSPVGNATQQLLLIVFNLSVSLGENLTGIILIYKQVTLFVWNIEFEADSTTVNIF